MLFFNIRFRTIQSI